MFRGGPVKSVGASGDVDWVLVVDGLIEATGARDDEPGCDRTVELDGATLLPAFCDAHVHLPATGLYQEGMDFRGQQRSAPILEAFTERARSGDGLLFGGNFEDPLDEPLTRHHLDAAVGDRPALLARADMHSCIVSSALLDHLTVGELEGVDREDGVRPTGYLREQAAAEAWRWFDTNLPEAQQRGAIAAAVQLAYSKGVASVHEMYVAEWRGWSSLSVLLEGLVRVALDVLIYVASDDVERVRAMNLGRIGGDFFLDGSFGSHTAWMSEEYLSAPPAGTPPNGIAYRTEGELVDFFTRAQTARLQTGVHAIGDAAIEQALTAWEKVTAEFGEAAVAALGHRIEHFECASDDHIARARRLGLKISVQPAFDAFWGGDDGLYASRIGAPRASNMNRFGTMLRAGLSLGVGSDSTVTPLDPFLQMQALCTHRNEAERMTAGQALRMHTLGSRDLGGQGDIAGTIEPGRWADLTAVDRDPEACEAENIGSTQVLGTWIKGEQVWPEEEAETR
ncbi:MAG: amidohydrolase family protein [Actinomycetota bacterium]|nr:amidohydrolase family protein [Actinomycetota bacterium]